jgi:miniconductance mechanosensitive channel
MASMYNWIVDWLQTFGLSAELAMIVFRIGAGCIVAALSIAAHALSRTIVLRIVARAVRGSRNTWDDVLLDNRVFSCLAHLAPALVIYFAAPLVFHGMETAQLAVRRGVYIYSILFGVMAFSALLNGVYAIYQQYPVSREIPIKGFLQVVKIVVFFFAGLVILSMVVQKNPLYLLSGLGAMTAVTMLVFKDAILGFVAGIQLTANNMLRHGDWIEMPKYGADGDVEEITLTTVKVRNWDKTITTIPTYALISESFRNWRGMKDAGGRRIMRSIAIDMNTVRFCTPEMLKRYARIQYIREYLSQKEIEIDEHNRIHGYDTRCVVNGRRLTNVGTFRAYVEAYLRHHPLVKQDMTFLVRQLQPGEHGLPIQIYVFCADTVWANYEAVQADIFDHILAVVPEFDLRVFQQPSGLDFRNLRPDGDEPDTVTATSRT